MEEEEGMEIEIGMEEEAAVPPSVGMRRRRNKSDAQASADGDIDRNNNENHGGRINGELLQQTTAPTEKKRTRNVVPESKRLLMYSEDAMELRLTWEEAQGWLEIFEDHDARNLLPATLETLLETIKSQMLSGSSIVIWGLRTEFEEIISTLNLIKAVAKDIEEKQSRSKAVELCLQMVKDAAYDADDVLDEITIKAQPEHKLSSMSRASSILSPFGSNKELKSMKIEGRLDHIAWQKDPFSIREQVGDREEVSSDTQTSSLVEKLQFHGKDNQEEESLLEISEKEMLVDGGEGSSEATEWTLLMTNLLLECMSAILDQLGYPLPGMVTAFVALVLSTIDLFLVAQKEKITWDGGSLLPCFHFHSTQ